MVKIYFCSKLVRFSPRSLTIPWSVIDTTRLSRKVIPENFLYAYRIVKGVISHPLLSFFCSGEILYFLSGVRFPEKSLVSAVPFTALDALQIHLCYLFIHFSFVFSREHVRIFFLNFGIVFSNKYNIFDGRLLIKKSV